MERWPSWSPTARSGTSVCPRSASTPSAGPTPCTRSPPLQSEYSLWTRDPESGGACRCCASWASGSSPTRRWAAAFSPAQIRSVGELPDSDFRKTNPRFADENFQHNLHSADEVRVSPPRSATPRRRSRWPGCWPRVTTSCRFRAPSGSPGWRRTSPPTSVAADPDAAAATRRPHACRRRPPRRGADADARPLIPVPPYRLVAPGHRTGSTLSPIAVRRSSCAAQSSTAPAIFG